MKSLNLSNFEVDELTNSEILEFNGGSWISYFIGYIVGTVQNISEAYSLTDEGKAVQQALLDFQ